MLGSSILPELQSLINERNFAALREAFTEMLPADIAEIFIDIPEQDQAVIFRLLPKELATNVFEFLDLDAQKNLIRALSQEQVSAILDDMSEDDRTALLEELPAPVARQLLSLLSADERATAQKLLNYPEGSVGRLMTTDFIDIAPSQSVKEVLDYIRENGRDSETLNVVYVTDEKGKLIDDIRIREFLLSPLTKTVSDLMNETFVALSAYDTEETASQMFKKYGRVALPVTDSNGILLGIVTVDDVLTRDEEAATEDIQKLGGTAALDEPYLDVPFFTMIRKRAGWLVILFIGEMLTATAMGYFEDEIARAVVLAVFIPLIISSGGNSGSQATSLIIRALAIGEITLGDWWRISRREFFSGLMLGTILGVIGFLRIAIWSSFFDTYGEHWLLIAFTVSFSLVGVVTFGTLSGSMLPFILKRLGLDPATASAPFVATLVDVTGLIIYFLAAAVILRGTLL
jgi:magnesium transporter